MGGPGDCKQAASAGWGGWTTVDDEDDDNSHSGGGRPLRCHPLPPLPSLIADAFASLSLLALSVAFGRPETNNARALQRTRVVVIVFVAVAVGPRKKSTAATRLPSQRSPTPSTPPPSSPQIIGSDSVCDPLSCVASGSSSTLPII